ncbi:hypothetical protein EON70_00945 [bacterium]|nr:MAG: hypothetical protein EON70_00945 [bacterium]
MFVIGKEIWLINGFANAIQSLQSLYLQKQSFCTLCKAFAIQSFTFVPLGPRTSTAGVCKGRGKTLHNR